ncbi:hypothetical protein, partial [Pseudomonas syringae group genomosp. 7]|uniref:hypothetical protein n=1 Tax=Pseudomonas syringae group genomosp. 7 TaxID=251699 RepID=UPI00376FD39E
FWLCCVLLGLVCVCFCCWLCLVCCGLFFGCGCWDVVCWGSGGCWLGGGVVLRGAVWGVGARVGLVCAGSDAWF